MHKLQAWGSQVLEKSSQIICEVNSIMEDINDEVKANALKNLGKYRRIAYANRCRDAYSLIKEAKIEVETFWVYIKDKWPFSEDSFQGNSSSGKTYLLDSSTDFGSKALVVIHRIEYDRITTINIINELCNTLENTIDRYLALNSNQQVPVLIEPVMAK